MPSGIPIEQPPLDTEQPMSEYLARQFININNALGSTNEHVSYYNMPPKPREGVIYYFGAPVPPDIIREGFWCIIDGVWKPLSNVSTASAVGGIRLATPTAFPDLTPAWQQINIFDTELLANPLFVDQDFAGSQVVPQLQGTYMIALTLGLRHAVDPAKGRELHVRIPPLPEAQMVSTARSETITRFDITSFARLTPGPITAEISSPDVYTGLLFENLALKITSIVTGPL